jgi:triosephosphate isomerase
MTRPRIVIGNWKMNPATIADSIALARAVAVKANAKGAMVGVAPPAIALAAVAETLRGSSVAVYAQDVHWEERGAFTGQLSVTMLDGLAAGSIVGHSEVRRYLGDDDERIARKLVRVLRGGLRPVLCVGETEDVFDEGATEDLLAAQIGVPMRALKAADPGLARFERLVIAYEPVWAIGTGRPATPEHASAAAATIRLAIREETGRDGAGVPVLYGGSVTAAGCGVFATADGIDGALVGGASVNADEFAAIVRSFA